MENTKFKFIIADYINDKKYKTRAYNLNELLILREIDIVSELHENDGVSETANILNGKVQFSGISDFRNTEIYEKDRIRMFGIIHTVEILNGAFGYFLDEPDGEFISFNQIKKLKIKDGQTDLIEVLN